MKKICLRTLSISFILLYSNVVGQNATSIPVKDSNITKTSSLNIKVAANLQGFPIFINTGDAEADKIAYEVAKNKWVRENNDLYNQYLLDNNSFTIPSNQNLLFQTDNSKSIEFPGFPVYINTGNTNADLKTYENAKQKWINENIDLYNQTNMTIQNTETKKSVEFSMSDLSGNYSNTDLPGFPEFIETGNLSQDIENYSVAKDKWIKENPKLYDEVNKINNTNKNKQPNK